MFSLLFDDASIHKIAYKDCCGTIVVGLLLHLRHLLLELVELSELSSDLVLAVQLGLLVVLDLLLGSSSLAAHLEHVGANAMQHYMESIDMIETDSGMS